jgi:hypothetical protein
MTDEHSLETAVRETISRQQSSAADANASNDRRQFMFFTFKRLK